MPRKLWCRELARYLEGSSRGAGRGMSDELTGGRSGVCRSGNVQLV